ncbi:uncharacterized protein LOC123427714 isoform X1 [Hordeum vulgare subsp. vulgare]|uniref:uncharacterized protein LOC123427714 isoform X1 n=1 Tax=Hordeum vulgare subsp. vulgare TaxID=112509 RepID=UPI000B469311|nr:uncharacterized protein LOC123427714 isoform X1 [Hordeum vulgare subsp. vulgare]
MKKPMLFLALEVLLVAALLLLPGRCQGSQGANANLTVTGTVFCDACSSSSFSNHSYFLPASLCSFVRREGQDRLRDQGELAVQGGGQDHGREDHRQPRRLPARHPGGRRPRVHHRRRGRVLLPGRRAAQPLAALRRAGPDHHRPPHLLLVGPGPRRVPLQPQLPLLPPGQEGRPVRRRWGVAGGRAEHVALLLPALAVAAHPVLHAPPVVPAHTVPHAAAAGVPVSSAAIPADTVLHATVAATAGFSFPFAAVAMDPAGVATSTVVPVPSSATDFLGTISAAAATTACIPIPFAAVSTAASFSSFSASAVAVFATASSSSSATTSAAFLPLAFPAITILPSDCKPFGPVSSTFKALPERSDHLVLFQNPTINKVQQ